MIVPCLPGCAKGSWGSLHWGLTLRLFTRSWSILVKHPDVRQGANSRSWEYYLGNCLLISRGSTKISSPRQCLAPCHREHSFVKFFAIAPKQSPGSHFPECQIVSLSEKHKWTPIQRELCMSWDLMASCGVLLFGFVRGLWVLSLDSAHFVEDLNDPVY